MKQQAFLACDRITLTRLLATPMTRHRSQAMALNVKMETRPKQVMPMA
jgi:hypothetical protein